MAVLITDSIGQPKPQYENAGGTAFESWKGASGHGNVRSDDGQIISIGSKTDPKVTNSTADASVIALLKGILDKSGGGSSGGGVSNNGATNGNAWNGVSVAAGGSSATIDVTGFTKITIYGWTNANTTIKIQGGVTSGSMYTFYRQNVSPNPDSAGYFEFHYHFETAFNFIKLISTDAASQCLFTIAAKS